MRDLLQSGLVVVHCAALHAPHRGHAADEMFRRTNVEATGRLVGAAAVAGVARFVFTSTTSVYGHVFDDPAAAVWIDESIEPRPRDIYDETKLAAEQLVADAYTDQMQTLTLRIARCFPEPHRDTVINRLYRGVDLRDVVHALVRATDTAVDEHHVLNIAGPRVFERSDCVSLLGEAETIIAERLPWLVQEFDRRGWTLPRRIDRVYVSDEAQRVLGYCPSHGVTSSLDQPEGDELAAHDHHRQSAAQHPRRRLDDDRVGW